MTMVIAQHCGLLPFGWIGVWLFYAISGYVITMSLAKEQDEESFGAAFGSFMRRRVARIVPAYALYVLVSSLVLGMAVPDASAGDLPYLATFTYNFHMVFEFPPGSSKWAPFGHLWTVSVEQQFYLVFPFLILLLRRRTFHTVCWSLIVLGPVVRLLWGAISTGLLDFSEGHAAFAVYALSFCHFDAFLWGAMIAQVAFLTSDKGYRLLRGLALGSTLVYAATYVGINYAIGARGVDVLKNVFSGVLFGQGREAVVYSVVNLASAALVIGCVRREVPAVLSSAPVTLVGRISYGGYLVHALLIWVFRWVLDVSPKALPIGPRLAYFVGVWLCTVAVAWVSFRWFERPASKAILRKPEHVQPATA